MSGLCGWMGDKSSEQDAQRVLSSMASGLPDTAGTSGRSAHGAGHGLRVEGLQASATSHFFADESVVAAIDGHPIWEDRRLGELAEREGHGAALAVAYKQFGKDLFQHLKGAWALAVLEPSKQRALVAIDRLAVRPLCFAEPRGGGLVFATTADSVRAHPMVDTTLNHQAVFDYLYFTRVPAPETIYREIGKLLPGQYAWFDRGRSELGVYWRLKYGDGAEADASSLESELAEVLRRGVGRAIGSAPAGEVGAFLSGGVDSSTITGLLAERFGDRAAVFTVGFDAEGFDEMAFARTSARHFGVSHHEYYVTPGDVAGFAPTVAEIYDEPYGNASAVPAYYCARLARDQGVRVLLAGDGGDELFAGNKRYRQQIVFEAYHAMPKWLRRNVLEPFVLGFPGGAAIPPVRLAQSYIRRANIPLPDRMESYNFYNTIALEEFFAPDVVGEIDLDHPLQLMREAYAEVQSQSALNRMLNLDLRFTLADDDLRKVERTAEHAGVVVRYPLLDEEVVEFAARVPPSLQLKGPKLRFFFKEAMRGFLPESTLNKQKHGFGLPFGLWLTEDPLLKALAYDNLATLRKRNLFLPRFLDSVIETHKSGHPSFHGELVWVLMMLELWFQAREDRARRAAGAGYSADKRAAV